MIKVVATNRKARADYNISEVIECGIVLTGTEVKSIRNNGISLKEGFARLEGAEVFLYNVHISPYKYGNIQNHEPLRRRKLLLRKNQINSLFGSVNQKGFTLIPIKLYFKNGYAKVEIGLARGKKHYDKRESIKKKEVERDIDRALKNNR